MKNLSHIGFGKENHKYIYFAGDIPTEKFGNLEKIGWVKEHLSTLKSEIGDLENIDRAKTITLLEEVKDVSWKKGTEAEGGSPIKSAKYVFALQSALHMLGHGDKVGEIDALWGGKSAGGLKEFQQEWNTGHPTDKIAEDGIPGPQSISRIMSALGGAGIENDGNTIPHLVGQPGQVSEPSQEGEGSNLDLDESNDAGLPEEQPGQVSEPSQEGEGSNLDLDESNDARVDGPL